MSVFRLTHRPSFQRTVVVLQAIIHVAVIIVSRPTTPSLKPYISDLYVSNNVTSPVTWGLTNRNMH